MKQKEKQAAAEAEQTVPDTTEPAHIHPIKYKAIPVDITAPPEPKMHAMFSGEARETPITAAKQEKTI